MLDSYSHSPLTEKRPEVLELRSSPEHHSLLQARLRRARRAFTTRRVDFSDAEGLNTRVRPKSGDLVLARVQKLGQHRFLESPEGRRQQMHVGDEIIVAYGNRYAPDQFDAEIPDHLSACDLVAGGGIASSMKSKHSSIRNPTTILPLGLLVDQSGEVLNLMRYALPDRRDTSSNCPVIAIVGTAMNAGKTTTAASLIHGLYRAGLRVGAAKITGTGSGGDLWSMHDAGARSVLDFTDAGISSTAGVELSILEKSAISLISHASTGNDIVIVEIADGLLQKETRELLLSNQLRPLLDKVILAAGDAMGATFGVQWLQSHNLPLAFISGRLSASPLALIEARQATGLYVATLEELLNELIAPRLCLAEQLEYCAVSWG